MSLETKVVLLRSLANNSNTDPVSVVEEFGPWYERDRKSKVQRSKAQMCNLFGRMVFSGAEILFDSSELCGLMLFSPLLQESRRLQTELGLIQNI